MNFFKIWFLIGTLTQNTDALQPEFVWKTILNHIYALLHTRIYVHCYL